MDVAMLGCKLRRSSWYWCCCCCCCCCCSCCGRARRRSETWERRATTSRGAVTRGAAASAPRFLARRDSCSMAPRGEVTRGVEVPEDNGNCRRAVSWSGYDAGGLGRTGNWPVGAVLHELRQACGVCAGAGAGTESGCGALNTLTGASCAETEPMCGALCVTARQ